MWRRESGEFLRSCPSGHQLLVRLEGARKQSALSATFHCHGYFIMQVCWAIWARAQAYCLMMSGIMVTGLLHNISICGNNLHPECRQS